MSPGVFSGLLLLSTLALLAPVAPAARLSPSAPASSTVIHQEIGKSDQVNGFATTGPYVLTDLAATNGTTALVLTDAATNTSRVIQWNGLRTDGAEMVGAGDQFYVEGCTYYCARESLETVSTTGTIRSIPLPGTNEFGWVFQYANRTDIYATGWVSVGGSVQPRYLDEFNASTLSVVRNFSGLVPTSVLLSSVVPDGRRLYLAGDQQAVISGTNGLVPFFGVIAPGGARLSTVNTSSLGSMRYDQGFFQTVVRSGGSIYLGGGWANGTTGSVQGLLVEYNVTSHALTNLSGLLPKPSWYVLGLVAWGPQVGLATEGWAFSTPSSPIHVTGGGLYTYRPGATRFSNHTATWGTGYVPGYWGPYGADSQLLAGSDRYVASVGIDTITGLVEINVLHR